MMENCLEHTIAESEASHQKVGKPSNEGASSTQQSQTMQRREHDAGAPEDIWPNLFKVMELAETGEAPDSVRDRSSEAGSKNWLD
jgi:hypothetical protein